MYLQLVIRNVVFRDIQIRGNCEESYEEGEDAVVHDCDKSSSDRVGAVPAVHPPTRARTGRQEFTSK